MKRGASDPGRNPKSLTHFPWGIKSGRLFQAWAVGTLLVVSGCRCGSASYSNEQPPSDLTASTRANESGAESPLAFPVTSATAQSTTDASSPDAAEVAPGGLGLRIITRGVDDYVILGDRSFSVLHELFYKDRLIIPARDNEKMIGLKLFGLPMVVEAKSRSSRRIASSGQDRSQLLFRHGSFPIPSGPQCFSMASSSLGSPCLSQYCSKSQSPKAR